MATGMIKRGSGSAYTRLIRRRRVQQIKAQTAHSKGASPITRPEDK